MSWIEVKATFPTVPEDWSPFVDVFLRHGIENSLQTDAPPTLSACVVEVEGSDSVVAALVHDLYASGSVEVETKPYEEQDWEEAWKKFFVPRRVGRRFVIVPTWESFSSEPGDLVITLDPGQAFGTGDHPTTRMCLALMEDVPVSGASVLDVGCGSGILSVGACLSGAASVLAVDIEPLAVEVARENAALNGVEFEAHVSDGIPTSENRNPKSEIESSEFRVPRSEFDIVLSNIISAALIRIAGDVRAVTHDGSFWIVSGILEGNWPDVLEAAEAQGFALAEKREEDGWVAATFRR